MTEQRNTPVWPFVGIVLCLIILTLLAPRAWRKIDLPPRAPAPDAPAVAARQPPRARNAAAPREPTLASELFLLPPRYEAAVYPPVAERVELSGPEAAVVVAALSAPAGVARSIGPESGASDAETPNGPELDDSRLEVSRQSVEREPNVLPFWPAPLALRQQLEDVKEINAACAAWSAEVVSALEQLSKEDLPAAADVPQRLERLHELAQRGRAESAELDDFGERTRLLRTAYSLLRRLALWEVVQALAESRATSTPDTDPRAALSEETLDAATERVNQVRRPALWREYLLTDEARKLTEPGTSDQAAERRELARRILARVESPYLSERQQAFFHEPEFTALSRELKQVARQSVDLQNVLHRLEQYELDRTATSARVLAEAFQVLRWAENDDIGELGQLADLHYRNANLRFAISGYLINRLLPQPGDRTEPLENLLPGSRTVGHSRTTSRFGIELTPDKERWRLNLVARGAVNSETVTQAGPATFYNDGNATFSARKLVLVDRRGARVSHTQASANGNSNLTGLQTEYDGLPVMGAIARSTARREYGNRIHDVERQMESTVAGRVRDEFDIEVTQRLTSLESRFYASVLEPLYKLDLNPLALEMQTTSERLVARCRLAGEMQLAAHTPRPQAPGDSLASLQIHESAINNLLEQLQLDGREMDLLDLIQELKQTFNRRDLELPVDVPQNVRLRFADSESLRVRCQDGRLTLTIRLAELSRGERYWTDFDVQAHYRPEVSGRSAILTRDTFVELRSEQLGLRDQVSLRGIFTKVLSRNRPFRLIHQSLADNPRLADLEVTQFEIQDGWVGLALGPRRTGTERTARN